MKVLPPRPPMTRFWVCTAWGVVGWHRRFGGSFSAGSITVDMYSVRILFGQYRLSLVGNVNAVNEPTGSSNRYLWNDTVTPCRCPTELSSYPYWSVYYTKEDRIWAARLFISADGALAAWCWCQHKEGHISYGVLLGTRCYLWSPEGSDSDKSWLFWGKERKPNIQRSVSTVHPTLQVDWLTATKYQTRSIPVWSLAI